MGEGIADGSFFAILGAVLASGAAATGFLVGVNQLSSSAIARRTIEWVVVALEQEEDGGRRQILEYTKLRAQGYLVAARYIPWWRFVEFSVLSLMAPLLLVLVALYESSIDNWLPFVVVVFVFLGLTAISAKALSLYSERVRIIHRFTEGGRGLEDIAALTGEEQPPPSRKQRLIGSYCSSSILVVGSAVAWAITDTIGAVALYPSLLLCWSVFAYAHSNAWKWARETSLSRA